MKPFKDDTLVYLESDIEKIQVKTNMYIQKYGPAGEFHLLREVVQNSVDESINENSPCRNIIVEYDEETDCISVEDDGRGIPESESLPLELTCTKIQMGSKMSRAQGGSSSGEFGVGLTVVNALSDWFMMETYRPTEQTIHRIEFKHGIKCVDERMQLSKTGKQHGTIIRFIASPKYLGKNTRMPMDDVREWMEKLALQVRNPETVMKLTIFKGSKKKESFTFKAQPFENIMSYILVDDKPDTALVSMVIEKNNVPFTDDLNKTVNKDIHIDISFCYSQNTLAEYESYCNFTKTSDGGTHVSVTEECICRYLVAETKKIMTDKEKEKMDILWSDVKDGLILAINLSTNAPVNFVGNAKTKIENADLVPIFKEMINSSLDEYFTENQKQLQSYTKMVKQNAKARIELSKIKQSSTREKMDIFKEAEMDNYIPPNNRGSAYKELHLIEGQKSAAGSAVNGRDQDTQGFYGFRGVTASAFKRDLQNLMENPEWAGFVKVLRCGIGKSFDITKLYFDKIIIMADADVDGANISSGIGAFMFVHYPDIIRAGRLYRVYPPLYFIDDKNHPYVKDKAEYVSVYRDKIIAVYKITLLFDADSSKGLEQLKKSDFKTFIYDVSDYLEELHRVAKHYSINKFLIERIAAFFALNVSPLKLDQDGIDELFRDQRFISKIMSYIQEKFPEITLKGSGFMRGVIDGHFQSIQINARFFRKVSELIHVYTDYGLMMEVQENNKPNRIMSVGEFLEESKKFIPKIITRFKGLGEADSKQLEETTLDPNNRYLVQLTMDDFDRDLNIFRKIHGHGKKNIEDRSKMMSNYKIKREDLDN